eukprot:2440610-Pleurochrysis_carterae.AAC.12
MIWISGSILLLLHIFGKILDLPCENDLNRSLMKTPRASMRGGANSGAQRFEEVSFSQRREKRTCLWASERNDWAET